MYPDGICKKFMPPSEPLTPINLTSSVGSPAPNLEPDVKKVQDALNYVKPEKGGPMPKLVVDGKCGTLTVAAINKFQGKEFGWFDSHVDPDKKTIKRLAQYKGGLIALSTQKAKLALAEALNLIRGAQANLLMALPFIQMSGSLGSYPSLDREARMRHVNRHFEIEKTSDPGPTLQKVIGVYDTMLEIFRHPGGLWGSAIFEPDPLGRPLRAYTFGGGYYRSGQRNAKWGDIRMDSIYLCEKLERDTLEKCAHTIVHELAHFVGSERTFAPISDHGTAYGWYDDPCMQKLAPDEKVKNADNYANFAFDLKYGHAPVTTQP